MIVSEAGDELDVKATEENAIVRRQLDRILAYSSFRNSRRYQAFLRYVVEEKLQGNSVHLKERMIGVAVFHQPLDYDTNANSVVRVTAGEIRRRLAQYYLEADPGNEILIELPLGSYVPEFHLYEPAALPEVTLPEPQQEVLSESKESSEKKSLVADETESLPKRSLRSFKAIAVLLGCGLLVSAVISASRRGASVTSESDRIWKGAFASQSVLICAGSLDSPASGSRNDQGTTARTQHSYLGFSFTTARTATIIGTAIGHVGGSASMVPAQDTKFEDLQRSPVVLIGAFNNEWTLRLQFPLRYQFFRSPQSLNGIVDTKNPNSKPFVIDNGSTRDYGIFAHFQSPTTGQSTVIAAGLGAHGTAAVRLFLSSPELLKEFSKSAPSGWENGNYEIVLASDLVNNLADPPKIVDAYFW